MSWLTEMQDPSALRDRASKSLNLPMGLTNPLWLAFGAAAGVGAAWWLLTRWGRPRIAEAAPPPVLPPVEAPPPAIAHVTPEPEVPEPEAPESQALEPETLAPDAPASAATPADAPTVGEALTDPQAPPVTESLSEPQAEGAEAPLEPEVLPEANEDPSALEATAAEAAPAAQPDPPAAPPPAPDDLTRLVGVGPRTAAALAKRGVTQFAQLAAWSAEEMAAFDAEMKLMGRSARNAWRDQARTLAGAP